MFDPKYLQYLGNNNGIDVFNYNGLRINAIQLLRSPISRFFDNSRFFVQKQAA